MGNGEDTAAYGRQSVLNLAEISHDEFSHTPKNGLLNFLSPRDCCAQETIETEFDGFNDGRRNGV